MFEQVGRLIKDIPQRPKSYKAIVAIQVRQVAKNVISSECSDLPPEILATIKPTSFKAGSLTVKVNSPLVASELKMRASGLTKEINKMLGKKVVSELRTTLK